MNFLQERITVRFYDGLLDDKEIRYMSMEKSPVPSLWSSKIHTNSYSFSLTHSNSHKILRRCDKHLKMGLLDYIIIFV